MIFGNASSSKLVRSVSCLSPPCHENDSKPKHAESGPAAKLHRPILASSSSREGAAIRNVLETRGVIFVKRLDVCANTSQDFCGVNNASWELDPRYVSQPVPVKSALPRSFAPDTPSPEQVNK